MNHRWQTIEKGRYTLQVCERCGISRKMEPAKVVDLITQIPPYYHYKWKNVLVYYSGDIKTTDRLPCISAPSAPEIKKEYKQLSLLL